MSTFDTVRNLVSTTLGSPRSLGAASFTLASGTGALFGSAFPLLFTATPASNLADGRIVDRDLVSYYRATGRTGDTLTGCTLVEGTDRSLTTGDIVALWILSQHLEQLQAAVLALEVAPPAHDHDDRYFTEAEAAALLAEHLAEADPHPQYLTQAEGDARYDAAGAAVGVVVVHEAQGDPHPQYQTAGEAAATADARIAAAVGVTVAALAHGHAIADVSGLQAALDGKAATGHAHSAADVTSGTLATARGGLGVALADPDADRIVFWDDSAGAHAYLTVGSGLSISGTTISASASGIAIGSAVSGGGANRILYQDGSQNLAASSGLTYTGTELVMPAGHFVSFGGLNKYGASGSSQGQIYFFVSLGIYDTANANRQFFGYTVASSGGVFQVYALSSTGAMRVTGSVRAGYIDSTDSSRKGMVALYGSDAASDREAVRAYSDGSAGRAALAAPASAPTSGHLANSQVSFYLDEPGASLKILCKQSDGTSKTASIPIS